MKQIDQLMGLFEIVYGFSPGNPAVNSIKLYGKNEAYPYQLSEHGMILSKASKLMAFNHPNHM